MIVNQEQPVGNPHYIEVLRVATENAIYAGSRVVIDVFDAQQLIHIFNRSYHE